MIRPLIALHLLIQIAPASDWPQWRGPQSNGHAPESSTPVTQWAPEKNIRWKTALPGLGHSTPIAVGKHLYLTTSDTTKGTQSLIAIDRTNGKILWEKQINTGPLTDKIHRENTHASPSPTWDGQRILTLFHNSGKLQLTATTPEGNNLWTKYIGKFHSERGWGYGSSPALYKNTIIIASDFRPGGYLVALDTKTGTEKWRTPRNDPPHSDPSLKAENASWGTPVIAHLANQDQLLLSGRRTLSSYNPANGTPLWIAPHAPLCTCGTPVWTDHAAYVSGGYPTNQTIAVAADGSAKTLWQNTKRSYEQSMLIHASYLYAITDRGIAHCWRATDGQEMWQQRIGRGGIMASPTFANGMIYATMKNGTTTIFKATSQSYQEISVNKLGDDTYASPIIIDDEIYLRVGFKKRGKRTEFLYCIGSEKPQ